MRSLRILSICCLVLVGAAPRLCAGQFTQIVAFGDSLIDTGNFFAASGQTTPASPPYFNGRWTNGPAWVELLASGIGVPDPQASLLGGTDYAYGGAKTSLSGVSGFGTPNIGTQVTTYLNTNPTITPQSTLFVIGGGGNDFLQNVSNLPNPSVPVSNLSTEITELAQAGAKNFVVPTLPLLGERPFTQQQLVPIYGPGIVATLDSLTTQFNTQLVNAESGLESSLGIKIYSLDVNGLFEQVLANPGNFGFTNVTGTAKSGNFGAPGTVVPNPDQYLFWDPIHPTEAFFHLVGNAAVAAVVPEPSGVVMMGIGLATVAACARLRRRVA
jgi:phospholipase/lecithinase/hemolysin